MVLNFRLSEKMQVADFGCGAGHFAFSMAHIVGVEGVVYALDIRPEMLEVTSGYAKLHNMPQIITALCNLEDKNGSKLEKESLDLVLCAGLMHQASYHKGVMSEAYRILKPKGKIVIIDYKGFGNIKPEKLFFEQEAKQAIKQTGFTYKENLPETGDYHYGVVGVKE